MPVMTFLIVLLAVSFILNDINFMRWSREARVIVALPTVFSVPFSFMINND